MSKITGYVLDAETEEPIAGVAVYLLSSDGSRSGVLTNADDDGDYSFDQPAFGKMVEFDFPGYDAMKVDPAYISGRILLTPNENGTLEDFVVKSVKKKAIKKPNYVLPIALGSAAIVTFGVWLYKTYA